MKFVDRMILVIGIATGFSAAEPLTIGKIKILGADTETQKQWLLSQLPFSGGDTLESTELEREVDRTNRIMETKEESFTSYILMIVPPRTPEQTTRNLILQIKPRTVNAYDGGGAWFYIGNHNRDLIGQRHGIQIGYNALSANYETYVGARTYLGIEGGYSFSLDEINLDTNYHEIRGGLSARHEWNNIFESKLLFSMLGYSLCEKYQWWSSPDHKLGYVSLSHLLDFRYLKKMWGIGSVIEMGGGIAMTGDAEMAFRKLHADLLFRTGSIGAIDMTLLMSSHIFWDMPAYLPQFSQSQSYFRIKEDQPDLRGMHFLELQSRYRIQERQLGFTRMAWGALIFWEGASSGSSTELYQTFGPGAFISFTNPVAIEIVSLFGFQENKYATLKIESRQYF